MKSIVSSIGLMFILTFVAISVSAAPTSESPSILDETLDSLALSNSTKAIISRLLPDKRTIYVSDILGINSYQFRETSPNAYEEVRQILLRSRNLTLDLEPFEIEEYRQTGRIVDATPQSRIERLELRKMGVQELHQIGVHHIWEINNITDADWASMKWESARFQIPKAVARMNSRLSRRPRLQKQSAPKPPKALSPMPDADMDPRLRGFGILRTRGLLTLQQLQSKSERWLKANFDEKISRRLIDLIRSLGETYLDELEVSIAEGYLFRPISADLMNIPEEVLEKLGHPERVEELLKKVDAVDAKSPLLADPKIKCLKMRISVYRAGCNKSLRQTSE